MERILLVDDHPLMRKGLALAIDSEPDLTVVAQAENAEEALDAMDETNPDLAIVDISLPGMSGLELMKHMMAVRPDLRVLVVSRHEHACRAVRV